MKQKLFKPIISGIISSFSLLALYFFIMILSNSSFLNALGNLESLKWWIIPLVITFGTQVGLFVYAKDLKRNVSAKATSTSSVTSSVAMVACCAHHITDILPIIGLSILATVLTKYQTWFLAFGLASNLIGIWLMLREVRRTNL